MNSMKKIGLAAICFVGATSTSSAEEPVCHHCEDIREYNSEHHQNFEYYGDYLKSNSPSKDNTYDKQQSANSGKNNADSPAVIANSRPAAAQANSINPNASPAKNGAKPKN